MSDPANAVSAAPFVADAAPYVQAVIGTIVTAIVGFGVALVKRYVGLQISQATTAKIDAYVEQLAAREVAKASDNLATRSIDVGSPIVKAIADQVAAMLPKEMAALGLTPAAVAGKAAGAIGRLQASMTVVPATAAPAAAKS